MAINPDRNYQQLLTAAVAKTSRQTQDIVYRSSALTRILRDAGRVQVKRAGGPELRIPLEYDSLQATWFTGYDQIPITPRELLNTAVFPWARVVGMFSLNGTELLFTGGEEEQIDLMQFYLDAARKSVRSAFETGIVSDGTGDGGRQMIGFGGAIPTVPGTGVYGGIDRTTVINWRTSYYDATSNFVDLGNTWDSTTARPIIDRISLERSRGDIYPDLWIFDSKSWEAVASSFIAHQRMTTSRATRLGYEAMALHTAAGLVELVAAGGVGNVMPQNTAFGIDTNNLSIYEFPGQSFVPFHPSGGLRPVNQDAVAQGIVWSGQMVVENPLGMVRLKTA